MPLVRIDHPTGLQFGAAVGFCDSVSLGAREGPIILAPANHHRGPWPLEVEIVHRHAPLSRQFYQAGDIHHEHYRCEPRDLHRGEFCHSA